MDGIETIARQGGRCMLVYPYPHMPVYPYPHMPASALLRDITAEAERSTQVLRAELALYDAGIQVDNIADTPEAVAGPKMQDVQNLLVLGFQGWEHHEAVNVALKNAFSHGKTAFFAAPSRWVLKGDSDSARVVTSRPMVKGRVFHDFIAAAIVAGQPPRERRERGFGTGFGVGRRLALSA